MSADIIKIVTMFIKTILKKFRRIMNYVSKWNLCLYSLIWQNFPISSKKIADANRTQGVCHVIHKVFGSSLGKMQLRQVLSLWDLCDRFWKGRGRGFLLPPHPWAARKNTILNRVKTTPVLFFIADFNLSRWEFDSFLFKLVCCVVLYW